jgi:hypothetical protein
MTPEQAAALLEKVDSLQFSLSLGCGLLVALICALALSKVLP